MDTQNQNQPNYDFILNQGNDAEMNKPPAHKSKRFMVIAIGGGLLVVLLIIAAFASRVTTNVQQTVVSGDSSSTTQQFLNYLNEADYVSAYQVLDEEFRPPEDYFVEKVGPWFVESHNVNSCTVDQESSVENASIINCTTSAGQEATWTFRTVNRNSQIKIVGYAPRE